MKLVVGLGNPGSRYAATRHNIGFAVVDTLAKRWGTEASAYDKRFEGQLGEAQRGNERVFLLKPLTYMNLSGRSVAAFVRYYKLSLTDLLVTYDELDLPLGRIRVRSGGSAGGHKGMADIIRHLGSDQVTRIRVGIDKVHPSATVDYVLGRFDEDEREAAEHAIGMAADAAECWVHDGITVAMNRYNRSEPRP